jgi:hypothetical protein
LFNRIRAPLIAISLLVTALFAPDPVAASSVYTACHSPVPNYTFYEYASYSNVEGVVGQTNVQDLRSCVDVNGLYGATYVLPANMQDTDQLPFVQLGYGRLGPDTDALAWLFTPYDNNPGVLIKVSDWEGRA